MTEPKIAVIIHCHDLSILHYTIFPYLQNLTERFDLYLNFSEIVNKNAAEIKKYKKTLVATNPNLTIFFTTSDNRGTDNGGFIASTNRAFREGKQGQYKYVCKIHTKRSGNDFLSSVKATRSEWTNGLLKTLLGNENQVRKILKAFDTWEGLGFVSSSKFYTDRFNPRYNEKNYFFFKNKLNLRKEVSFPMNSTFLAGTMFWIRGEVWDFFMNKDLSINDFEIGNASDGLRTHAFERIYDAAVKHLGYGVYVI